MVVEAAVCLGLRVESLCGSVFLRIRRRDESSGVEGGYLEIFYHLRKVGEVGREGDLFFRVISLLASEQFLEPAGRVVEDVQLSVEILVHGFQLRDLLN